MVLFVSSSLDISDRYLATATTDPSPYPALEGNASIYQSEVLETIEVRYFHSRIILIILTSIIEVAIDAMSGELSSLSLDWTYTVKPSLFISVGILTLY